MGRLCRMESTGFLCGKDTCRKQSLNQGYLLFLIWELLIMYKHLFVPVDGSELSHRAMDGSIELALQLGARITGFVVEPDLPLSTATRHGDEFLNRVQSHESKNEAHASALLGQFEKRASTAGVPFTAHQATAYRVAQSIVEAAEQSGCDMIVMVSHSRSRVGKFVLGSHTKDVIIESKLPVLVLR